MLSTETTDFATSPHWAQIATDGWEDGMADVRMVDDDGDVADMRAPTHGGVREEIARLKYRIPAKGVSQPWRAASRMLLVVMMIVVNDDVG